MPDGTLSVAEREHVTRTLLLWLDRCRAALDAYNAATVKAAAVDRWLGSSAAALSAVVATSVFATAQAETDVRWRLVTGVVAIAAAVLAALQAFLRHGERSERYRETARRYGAVRRRIERALVLSPDGRDDAAALLAEVAEALDEAGTGKPNVPGRVWARARARTLPSRPAAMP